MTGYLNKMKIAINRAKMTKFGFTVGELTVMFSKK